MDREKVVTIVLGLIVGVTLAVLYFFGGKYIPGLFSKAPQKPVATSTQKKSPPPPPVQNNSLTISSPDDHSSTTSKTVKFTGTFIPAATIILFGPADQAIATADGAGKFSSTVTLESGENEITLSSFDQNNKLVSVKRNITLEVSP